MNDDSLTRPLPAPPRRRRRRGRRVMMTVFALIVLLALLVIGDRVSDAVAENDMANQFTANGFPVRPSVDITGFPFLTQLAVRDFSKVDVSASNIPVSGGVTITTLTATLTGMHLNSSFNGATIDHVTATAFISFGALAAAGGLDGTGITVTPAGGDLLKITASLGGALTTSLDAKVSQTGPQQITVGLADGSSGLASILSSFASYTFTLPKGVPTGLRITGLTLNTSGLTVSAAAANAAFSE